jgi:hypothetical protein
MKLFVTLLLGLVATVSAWAEQASPTPPTQQCPEDNAKRPPPTDNPSGRLAETKGVVCPPKGIDPDIHVKPPSSDSTIKIVPAPGTPGGDPAVQPK